MFYLFIEVQSYVPSIIRGGGRRWISSLGYGRFEYNREGKLPKKKALWLRCMYFQDTIFSSPMHRTSHFDVFPVDEHILRINQVCPQTAG